MHRSPYAPHTNNMDGLLPPIIYPLDSIILLNTSMVLQNEYYKEIFDRKFEKTVLSNGLKQFKQIIFPGNKDELFFL
jgi:hypothetical protein